MKRIISCIFIMLGCGFAAAQKNGTFLRIYDNNTKIHKGHLYALTDSSLFLLHKNDTLEIAARKISTIKLRHSFGHTIALSTGISAVALAIAGAFTGEKKPSGSFDLLSYTPGEGISGGFAVGAGVGLVAAGITEGAGSKRAIIINKDPGNWKKATALLITGLPKIPKPD